MARAGIGCGEAQGRWVLRVVDGLGEWETAVGGERKGTWRGWRSENRGKGRAEASVLVPASVEASKGAEQF